MKRWVFTAAAVVAMSAYAGPGHKACAMGVGAREKTCAEQLKAKNAAALPMCMKRSQDLDKICHRQCE